jgi:hypothetical protein
MNDFEYKSNSHKSKEMQTENRIEKKRVEKVIKGSATTRKNEMRRFTDVFISEDVKNVKEYLIMDVLVPTIKKTIVDVVTDSVSMIFGMSPRRGDSKSGKVSYDRFYNRNDTDRTSSSGSNRTRNGYSYDDIALESRQEAEEVLTRMDELVETYGEVTVADLYDLVGVTCEFTDNNYGWTNIRNAKVVRLRDGKYMIDLPKALPINRR